MRKIIKLNFLKYITSFFLFILFVSQLNSQTKNSIDNINDGPYILIKKKKLVEKIIVNGKVFSKDLSLDQYNIEYPPEKSYYKNVSKIVCISDIHGQYDLALNILKNNKIIDDNLKWNFGDGHMVIVGDIFDRGDKVTELLWFVYYLEEQAKKAGGKVHYLLGNHELMVLENDLRYIHEKYEKTTELLGRTITDLFDKNTVLGRWLRSKSTILKIDDKIFVHGGLSKKFIDNEDYSIEKSNDFLREWLKKPMFRSRSVLFDYKKHLGPDGPLWYRGYFFDNLNETHIDSILTKNSVNHIIVGHTTNRKILKFYNKKIINVDSNIKTGNYGELLLIEKNSFSRLTSYGKKIEL